MTEIMLQLGPFQFGMDTAAYQEFERSTSYTWSAQSLYGQDDALQPTGPGEDTISLQGIIYPEFAGGTGQLDALRALGALQEPQTLIDGLGSVRGDWVVLDINEKGSIFAQRGVARRQEFTVKLRRFSADESAGGSGGYNTAVAPIQSGAAPDFSPLNGALSIAGSADSGAGGILSSLGSFASQIGAQSSSVLGALSKGMNAAKRLQYGAQDATRLLRGGGSITNITSAMNSLSSLGSAVSQTAGASSSILRAAGIDLSAPGVNASAVAAVRGSMVSVNQLNALAVNVRSTAQSILSVF